ncbi:MAG: hypothetical protein AB1791_11515, partial [Chloroflexota bacterium]
MAQWYAQLVFKGDTLIGEGLTDFAQVEGVVPAASGESYTTVVVSGYALYGQLRGYYALGVAQIMVDPASGRAAYTSEASARHNEPVESLTPAQRAAMRQWLVELNPAAWENSTESLRKSLE